MILSLLLACGPVRTAADAPFDVNGRSMLLVVDPTNSGSVGSAMLLITDEELSCDEVPRGPTGDVLDELLQAGGRGLALVATYVTPDTDDDDNPFEGLFTGAGGAGGDVDAPSARFLVPNAYDDGFAYIARDPDSSWLRLDTVDTIVRGEFYTAWWAGKIKARRCDGGGGGGAVDCTPRDADQFSDDFIDQYCNEWASCGSDEPCPVGGYYYDETYEFYCPDFDATAASECLCGDWTCNTEFAGFEFPEPPIACIEVCGGYDYTLDY